MKARTLSLVSGILGCLAFAPWMADADSPPPPDFDHLKCYIVRGDEAKPDIQTLENQFHTESDCKVAKGAKLFCDPTRKNGADDPRGVNPGNFLCYNVRCKEQDGPVPEELFVDDQAGVGNIKLARERYICTPTIKHHAPVGATSTGTR